MKIYVAASWRNLLQPAIVHALRKCGHDVYDYRNPYYPAKSTNNHGFSWADIDPNWESWTPQQYREALCHPLAKAGYENDIRALQACDACVMVLPSGHGAAWELGYAVGQGKRCFVVQLQDFRPELMYREATIIASMDELFNYFEPEDGYFLRKEGKEE